MTINTGLNPYDLTKLLTGGARVLYAPTTVAKPAKLTDVIVTDAGSDQYLPATGWIDFGATTGGAAYSRSIEETGYKIDQDTSDVISEVTGVVRGFAGTFNQVQPELLKIFEQAAAITTVAAGAHSSQEKQVKFGTIQTLDRYRIAVIGRKAKGIGADVTQSNGTVRGAFVMAVLYSCAISGDQAQVEMAPGSMAGLPLGFQGYPESGVAQGQEYGFWTEEQSGTISAS